MYESDYDERSQTLNLRLTDFWTEATMACFKEELFGLVHKLTLAQTNFVVFGDCRNYPVQSPEILTAWAGLLGPNPIVSAPYAVLAGSFLNTLQAERALTAPNVKVFTSAEAAKIWLQASRAAMPS
jgi:hypothetical protein